MNDEDSEIAAAARRAVEWQQDLRRRTSLDVYQDKGRRWEEHYSAQERRPELSLEALTRFETFEALWAALPEHRLPLHMEAQLAYFAEEKRRREAPEPSNERLEGIEDRQRKPIIQRLLQLYHPVHQPLLIAGLEDEDLPPYSVALLREHPAPREVLPLISQGRQRVELAVQILQGLPHAREASRLLCEELTSGRLRHEPQPVAAPHANSEIMARFAEEAFDRWWCWQLEQLCGLAAFLPLLEPGGAETWKRKATYHINVSRHQMKRSVQEQPEALAWVRRESEQSQDEERREVALWLLSVAGTAEDAEHWRPMLYRQAQPPWLLASVIRLVGRFGTRQDLPLMRSLLTHSPEVSQEAAAALATLGGAAVVEELAQLLETPTDSLQSSRHRGAYNLSDWELVATEAIIRFGDGSQAKRAARVMAHDREVWRVAARHIRLPEHILFIRGYLGNKDPASDDDDGYDAAARLLQEMINQVGAEPARRVMVEASLRGELFHWCFKPFIDRILPEDKDLLMARLREQPDHSLALSWLSRISQSEKPLDAVWRESNAPWWRDGDPG